MGRAFEYRKAAKLKRWGNMSKIFPKHAKKITIAAKEGGSGDPELNSKLRTAIMNAKADNVPKDVIEKAIKRALGKDAKDILEVNFEAKAPHGVLLFIECATDNNTRTVANVKSILNKNGGELLTNGSLDFMFSRKAVFEFKVTDDMDIEELELELIDAGLEEIEVEDGLALITTDYTDFGNMQKALEEMGIELEKAELERIPNTPVTLDDAQREEVNKIIDKLEDDEDVQHVFVNIA
jgi:YebC/PmpR family DNA-binding regulatory protein